MDLTKNPNERLMGYHHIGGMDTGNLGIAGLMQRAK
jgi:hypothetical protein